ncbi:MAG: TetR/AcrR family transcriptional regulator [Ramlibacter sp.]|nr:TetR/AcrR family transcriptional regulator [Ramlibacter sp.]MCW5648424.1 TetR/AcrR family transcriptional regulator [Ramlibacter sp.]
MTVTDFPVSTTTATQHRSRLLAGMAQAVAKKGYADTTIADVVREAAVSRRTFYEHFETKAECLVSLYEATSRNTLAVLRSSIGPGGDWQAQVEQALTAYLGCMAQNPVLLRTLFIEILGLGATGLAARRRTHHEIANFILEVVNSGGSRRIEPEMAMAVVGGVNELVLQAIERDRPEEILQAVGTASALVRSVTRLA